MESLEKIKVLLHQLGIIIAQDRQQREEREKRGEGFNVFATLGLWSNEVRLHSALLAEFLNPRGNHGMGSAFLNCFLVKVLNLPADFISNEINYPIIERYIGNKDETSGGRIDIILEDGHNAIIIENKIYAGDQDNQLLRYYNYGKRFEDFRLVYLTLDGHEASETSTGSNNEVKYNTLSYGVDVINWLYQCAMLAYDKPLVRETIRQYISLLKILTGVSMDKDSINKLVRVAVNDIDSTAALIGAQDAIGAYLRKEFLFRLLKKFADDNGLAFELDESNCHFGFSKKDWKGKVCVYSDYSKSQNWRSMFVGVFFEEEREPSRKLDCLEGQPTSWWPNGLEYLPSSFGDLNSANCYVAVKSGKAAEWIENKAKEIIDEATKSGIL